MDVRSMLEELSRSPDLGPFEGLVEPLVAYDRERGSDLIRTLRVYLARGANASEAADRLFLHRNSLLYRLARIGELTGLDLKDPRARLALQLGLLSLERRGTR
jgi:DNA-binding PucR family transcriptional regulator